MFFKTKKEKNKMKVLVQIDEKEGKKISRPKVYRVIFEEVKPLRAKLKESP